MRILTSDEVRQVEQQAISAPGMSTLILMQRAGQAVADFCRSNFKFESVCVICGKGNNGGDGMVAAEALRSSVSALTVIVLARDTTELRPDAQAMCSRLGQPPIWISDEAGFDSDAVRAALKADLILDAIVGTGFKPPIKGLAEKAVQLINRAAGKTVAVDLPSGVDADDTHVIAPSDDVARADGIVTFITPKPVHVFGELTSGGLAVSDLEVSPALASTHIGFQVITAQEVRSTFPPRIRDSNKGLYGHVLVIAGSAGKAGAAGLAGLAALRTGAGLVTVACPKSIQPIVAGFAPELMTEGLPETDEGTIAFEAAEKLEGLLAGKNAVVLGPGLSRNLETAQFIRLAVQSTLPLVLDADGLNAFEDHYDELKPPPANGFRVLTPHPGEAARLLGNSIKDIQSDRMAAAQRLAGETGSSTVLKGLNSIVCGASGQAWINMTGNPALSKGGSGDVLSGIIGAALARKGSRQSTADQDAGVAASVYLHGLIADILRKSLHENSVLATDLLSHLGKAFQDCDQQAEDKLWYLQKG